MEDPANIVQRISTNLCNPGHEVLRRTLGVYLSELNNPLSVEVRGEMHRLLSQALMLASVPDLKIPKTITADQVPACNICRDPQCPEPNQKH